MIEQELRKKLKNTLLIDENTKKKLLSMNTWSDSIIDSLSLFFDKFGKKEEKILENISKSMGRIYIKSINDIENEYSKKELEELKKLEEKLKLL